MGGATILRVKVKPGARASELVVQPDGSWLAQLKLVEIDG